MLYLERQREREEARRLEAKRAKEAATAEGILADAIVVGKPLPRGNQTRSKRPRPVAKEPSPKEKPKESAPQEADSKPPHNPKPEAKPQPEAKPTAPPDPRKHATFVQAVTDARVSLGEFDIEGARGFLDRAAGAVQGSEEAAQVERLRTLANYLEEFWKTMGKIVSGLEATEEIVIGEERVIVVETSPNRLIIKAQGRLRQYSPLDKMPHVLVTALAEGRFGKDASSKAVYGAYLAVAPDGDRQRARQLWEEAAQGGADVKDLFAELRAPGAPGSTGIERAEPPKEKAVLEECQRAVRERFKTEYADATSPAGKAELAKKLLQAGRGNTDEPDLRFVMLCEARDLAVAAGEVNVACAAIDALAKSHAVDLIDMKMAALEEIGKSARGLNSQKEIAQNALSLIAAAVKAKRTDEAKRLGELAISAAQKSKSTSLLKQVRAAVQETEGGK